MVVAVDRMTEAVPPNLACLLSGVIGHEEPGLLICSASTDWALIRTPAATPAGIPLRSESHTLIAIKSHEAFEDVRFA